MKTKQIKEEIEKRFLGIRGWKDWNEYDKIQESLELDINIRNEIIDITIQETLKEVVGKIDEIWGCDKIYINSDECLEFKEELKKQIMEGEK